MRRFIDEKATTFPFQIGNPDTKQRRAVEDTEHAVHFNNPSFSQFLSDFNSDLFSWIGILSDPPFQKYIVNNPRIMEPFTDDQQMKAVIILRIGTRPEINKSQAININFINLFILFLFSLRFIDFKL